MPVFHAQGWVVGSLIGLVVPVLPLLPSRTALLRSTGLRLSASPWVCPRPPSDPPNHQLMPHAHFARGLTFKFGDKCEEQNYGVWPKARSVDQTDLFRSELCCGTWPLGPSVS